MHITLQLHDAHLDTYDVTILQQEGRILQAGNLLAALLPLLCALPARPAPLE